MSEVVDFPSPTRPFTEEEVDKLHSKAFRNLEEKISDCTTMAHIAAGLAQPFISGRDVEAEHALFAVIHVHEMLKKLKADYYAAWHGEPESN